MKSDQLKLSVVVCTHNREAYLPECLVNLSNQNATNDLFEIIVVNNNCTDGTEAICLEFEKQHPNLNFVYTKEKKPGLSNARNKGIETARGEIISFIDDDGFAREDYVSEIIRIADNPSYDEYIAFGGKVIPRYNEGMEPIWLSKYINGVVSKVDLGEKVMPFTAKYPAGCNMIFRAEFFEQHGGFNADLEIRGDDKFVFLKLKAAGLKILYVPSIYVEHFMDDYRLEYNFLKRLSKIIGQSERLRLKGLSFQLFKKFVEYVFKYKVSLLLAFGFLIKGDGPKAKYIVMIRWNVFRGFFMKNIE